VEATPRGPRLITLGTNRRVATKLAPPVFVTEPGRDDLSCNSASASRTQAREKHVATGFLLIIVAALKCAVAIFPVLGSQGKLARPRAWRGLAWLATIVLTGYGAVNSMVAWLVLGGVLRPEDGNDRQSMIGHAYLWDPLFMVWGLLLGAGLFAGRRDRRTQLRASR
jgi:hypothetical protein